MAQPTTPIRYIRRSVFGVTQEELARIGRVSRSRVSRYESSGEPPSFAFMDEVRAEAERRGLRFSADWFFSVPVNGDTGAAA